MCNVRSTRKNGIKIIAMGKWQELDYSNEFYLLN